MKAIPNSKNENAIINIKGNIPNIPINPDFNILNVKPLNINNNICPANTLAANLRPSDTFLAIKDIVSIITNKGNKAKGQPWGTNNPKNFILCILTPKNKVPITIPKLHEKVSIKWLVVEKLYGIKPIKLLTSININNVYIKGKYTCPFVLLIWFVTTLNIVSYKHSLNNFQSVYINKLEYLLIDPYIYAIITVDNIIYIYILVKAKCILNNIGKSKAM